MGISLNNIRMNVIETSSRGVVNEKTIFVFSQTGNQVTAEYSGGKIARGFLVGMMSNDELEFCYCQLQTDDTLDTGVSRCKLSVGLRGRITMIEQFEWSSRPGEVGTNVFQQI